MLFHFSFSDWLKGALSFNHFMIIGQEFCVQESKLSLEWNSWDVSCSEGLNRAEVFWITGHHRINLPISLLDRSWAIFWTKLINTIYELRFIWTLCMKSKCARSDEARYETMLITAENRFLALKSALNLLWASISFVISAAYRWVSNDMFTKFNLKCMSTWIR